MTKLFFSYSHADENLRDMLETHLSAVKNEGLIQTWHDRCITAGDELDGEISENLENADIILLLVSSDFIASRYCYDVETRRAVERHREGTARVIPVILRPCNWHDTPFGKLLATPKDGKAVTTWANLDSAFLDITQSIKQAIKETASTDPQPVRRPGSMPQSAGNAVAAEPRSCNLRVRKTFSEADHDHFADEAFEYMAKLFENSLAELEGRNPALSARFKRLDATRFTAVVYRDGQAIARCKVVMGGMFGRGISYSSNDSASDNSSNENLTVEHDDQALFLRPLGMSFAGVDRNSKLTLEGAAGYYWSMLIQPLQ